METKKLLKNLKHKFSGMLCLVMLLGFTTSAWAADPSGKTLYLTPGTNWNKDSAKFCLYYYGSNSGWVAGSLVSGSGATAIYSFDIPSGKGITNVIFVRRDPSQGGCDWSWNQTNDLTYDGTNNLYTVADDAWSKGSGTWSTYNPCTGPTVTTGDATSVTAHTATLPGSVSSTTDLTEVGIKMGDSYYKASSVASSFSFAATNLESGKQYTYQAYAKKSCGTFLGTEKTFTTTSVTYEFTVYFKANSGWTNPYIHMWPVGSDAAFVNNQPMTAVAGASGWYKYDVTTTNQKWKIILKNGSEWGTKSEDSGPFDSTDSEHCYMVSNSKVTATDCPVICTTPQASDFSLSDNEKTYTGSAQKPTFSNAGDGTITHYYYSNDSGSTWTEYTDGPTNAGTYNVKVDVSAGTNYCAQDGIELSDSFVINQKTPTASDFSLSDNEKTYTGSALKPTFNKNTGVDCSFSKYYYSNDSGSTWTEYANGPTNAGTYKVKVDVAAGTNYSAATGIMLNSNFVINKASQSTLTISNETKEVCNGSELTLTTEGGSGTGAVTYDIVSGGTGAGTISSSTFTGTSAGTVLIKATKAADANYKEASSSNATFTVNPQNAIGSVTFDNSTIKKNATTTAHANDVVTSGATGSWSSDNTDVATVDASLGVVTGVSVGEANIIYTLPGGCNDTSKGAVNSKSAKISVLTDCDTPEAGTIGGTLNVCAGSGTTLTLTGYTTTGTTLQWYKDDAVITGATSNSYATGNLNASATYKVRVSKTASCYNDATAVTVTVTAIPTITNTNDGSRCGAGTVELQATASAGDVKWYSTSTSGTALKTGTSYTTPSISATTKYYVDATQNGCTTASRTAVTATVNTVPSISSIAASTEDSGCGAGTVKFTASDVSAGSTIHWYENSTKKGEGNPYNYNDVAAGSSVTLKAKAVHTNGCESEFTAPTTGTRKALPSLTTAPAGSAVTAYLWEPVNLTATTTDGTATVAISTTSTKYEVTDITNGKSLKAGNAGDTFTATYTATSSNGCQTQEVKTVTAEKATEDCSK